MNLGRIYGLSLKSSGFTDDIDLIIPVPLHPSKNGSGDLIRVNLFQMGLSDATGLPVDINSLDQDNGFSNTDKKIAV